MKKILSLLFCLALGFSLCACGEQTPPPTTPEPDDVAAPVLPVPEDSPEPVPEVSEEPSAAPGISVTLYKGDDNAEFVVPVECEIAEQSPQAIVDKLVELGVFGSAVTANSFTVDNSNVIHLDMGQDFAAQIFSSGTAGEHIMVGSLVNSFISVFEADAVLITVDGKPFESGHAVYDYALSFFEN
ncbi:MAG: GerMN domain-containing protein [Candidatus Limivicinus sp.]